MVSESDKSSGKQNAPHSNPSTGKDTTPIVRRADSRPIPEHDPPGIERPRAWEDDISKNALDDGPFENLPRPVDLDSESFSSELYETVAKLAGVKSLDEYLERDTFPLPCLADREGFEPDYPGNYWLSGLLDFLKLTNAAGRRGTTINSYLDLGCASGRVIRHFCAQANIAEIWGADINARHVRWMTEFLPDKVKPIANTSLPSLPIRDASVDLISAYSVFTHIDAFESSWLAELARILHPQGFAFITIHNEDTWASLRERVGDSDNRLVQSMINIDPETADNLQGPLPNTRSIYRMSEFGPYRSQVFHSNDYIQKVWGRYFNVQRILPVNHALQ
ncbi:MAG: class I SAM-dependent methyltransferase, partial [Pirellulaceae bacterium]